MNSTDHIIYIHILVYRKLKCQRCIAFNDNNIMQMWCECVTDYLQLLTTAAVMIIDPKGNTNIYIITNYFIFCFVISIGIFN